MTLRFFLIVVVVTVFFGCKKDTGLEKKISKIDADFSVERFDLDFGKAKPKDLPELKQRFPFLFSQQIQDSIWMQKLNDTLQQQMFREAKTNFKDFNYVKDELSYLFQHLKYYDKTFNIPRVITVADDVDYRTKTIVSNELIIINLLNYLGSDHEFYQNIPMYLSKTMKEDYIIPDVANGYAKMYAFQSKRKTFLEELIYFGKLLYFKDVMIPEFSDAKKIGYAQNELKWVQLNEAQIWSYFVERELLFSTDAKLITRFLAPAPFSKFYLQIDNDSPGQVGRYIGWQIVKAYAERTGADILAIMQTDADIIFNKSKYKPKK